MKDIVVILGPTASGKTKLAIGIANQTSCELISADSMQIYKKMDIGTAKPCKEEQQLIKHHMIDVVYPDEQFSVKDFQKGSFDIIDNLHEQDKLPIVVGGTGLYINSILYDLNFTQTPADTEFRNQMNMLKDIHGLSYLYELLKDQDPEAAGRIHPNDEKRIIRRLEVTSNQGSEEQFDFLKQRQDYNFIIFGLTCERSILYEKINQRVDLMIKQGLFNEVKSLYEQYGDGYNSLKAIGYKEIIAYFKGQYDKEEAIRLIKRNSRRFAKRQITWFKRDDRIKWVDISKKDCLKIVRSGIK